ncbi:MAG: sulfurtransferase TusA family protein [Nitrospinota bacterium]|nr:sulfurtransferase TusA family protein [Nitrospinota bacterium]
MSGESDKTLDCKGLSCPEPVLKTKMAMNDMQPGQVLEMVATDPGSANDIPAWARRTGNQIVESKEEGGVWTFRIKKS